MSTFCNLESKNTEAASVKNETAQRIQAFFLGHLCKEYKLFYEITCAKKSPLLDSDLRLLEEICDRL